MRAVSTLAWSDLRSRWRGWLTAALLVAVAGGVVLATGAGARRTDTAYTRFLRTSRAADVLMAANGEGGRQNVAAGAGYFAAVAKLPGVDLLSPYIGVNVLDPENRNTEVNLSGGTDARLGRVIERPKIIAGRMFDPARAGEVVADRTLADRLHLRVGSTMHLLVASSHIRGGFDPAHATALTVRVVGVGVTRDNVVLVNAGAGRGTLLVTPALLGGLTPAMYTYEGAFVRLSHHTAVPAFGRQAQALLSRFPETGGHLLVADEHQQAAKVIRAIRPQAVALALFALLVALTALLIIGQILVRQVFVATADHPTLRALGLTRVQLWTVGLVDVAVTVTVGAVLAVALAAALSPVMPIGPARLAEPRPGPSFDWSVLGPGAVAIVGLLVLRVAPALGRLAWRTAEPESASAAGRAEQPSDILEALTRVGASLTAVVGARMALEPGRGRSAIPVRSSLAGTAVAVVAVVAAFTFGANLVRLVDTPRLYGQTWQVSFDAQFGTIAPGSAEPLLRRQPGVAGWTFGHHGEATIAGRHVATIALTAAEGPAMFPTLFEGRTPQTPDEIVLGSKTLVTAHRRVGQSVMVSLPGQPTPQLMRIVGRAVFPFFGQTRFTPTGLGDGAALLTRGPNLDGFNFLLVAMVPGAAQQQNIAHLSRSLDAGGVCQADNGCPAVTAQRPADVNNYARIKATPLVLAGVLALLAAATVAHLLVTSIRRRRRDLAVLKTLGFLRRQVSAAVAWQATIVVALALLVGLPMGVAVGRWAWLLFASRLGVAPDPQVPLVPVLVFIPAALAVANAVAAGPGWVAGRLRPAPVLRAE